MHGSGHDLLNSVQAQAEYLLAGSERQSCRQSLVFIPWQYIRGPRVFDEHDGLYAFEVR